ncbi:cobalamin biosynthesis protein CobD/CbiB [Saccharomonospora glauca]|uniref:Cobalamin biosynthesis protein CobD n=1 Tax=Saccharomonospora glauca K62 TaxID=928724 RepID=I1CYD7_9PSEU|nr:cobalamin biosynthesis protein [Saccharomonospora glauca]EIE97711.1 cobalamin biosynthesis protein cobD/CbiB [Saccharomonospora glauca K62]
MSAARAVGLLLGVVADAMVGESVRGRADATFARLARAVRRRVPVDHPLAGAVHLGAVTGTAVLAGTALERLGRTRPLVNAVTTAAGTWAVLGGARLAADGTALARHLETGDLGATRETLAHWDSRCSRDLDSVALARASVEAVAHNASDTVVSPLLWGAVAGVPGLLASRAVGVARRVVAERPDSRRFALPVSYLDRVVNLLPTRLTAALTVVGAPVVGGSARAAWRAWRRDSVLHPNPNAGRVMAAYAGALEIRLGGRTTYPDGVRELPVLGDGRNPDAGHVTRAVELSRVVGGLAGVTSAAIALVSSLRRRRRSRGRG